MWRKPSCLCSYGGSELRVTGNIVENVYLVRLSCGQWNVLGWSGVCSPGASHSEGWKQTSYRKCASSQNCPNFKEGVPLAPRRSLQSPSCTTWLRWWGDHPTCGWTCRPLRYPYWKGDQSERYIVIWGNLPCPGRGPGRWTPVIGGNRTQG